jgi:hypothetical protein
VDLLRLTNLPISGYSRREQFAFEWTSTTELTVKLVVDHYPLSSLQPTAFTGANAELLLDRGAREHINHPRGAIATTGR